MELKNRRCISVVWVFLAFVFGSIQTYCQQYQHTTLWTRLQANLPLKNRWQIMGALHLRRQNNYQQNPAHFWQESLLSGALVQINRQNSAETITWIPAQINYFVATPLLGRDEDFLVPQGREWRYSAGFELNQKPHNKWIVRQRLLQEIRFFRANQYQPVGRVRGRLQTNYRLRSFVSINGITEIIFHNPPQLANAKPFRFHQFWLGSSLLWQLSPHLNVETGYTYIKTRRASVIEFDNQHVLNFNIFVRL